MIEIKIDKNIPIPDRKTYKGKYPFRNMEIGDSCFLPGLKSSNIGGSLGILKPKKSAVRSVVKDGVSGSRVWRIA